MKKRILFITGYYPFQQGGAEYQAFLLSEELKRTYNVSFTFRNHWNKKSIIQHNGYALYAVRPISIKRINENFILEMGKIKKLLKQLRPDIIYLRGGNAYGMAATTYAHNHQCRVIWHVAHDRDLIPLPHINLLRNPIGYTEKKIITCGLKNSTNIITQTEHQRLLLKQNYNIKSHNTIANWHPIPENTPKDQTKINVLWIANWRPFKQPEIFVRLAQALKKISAVRFIMIGRNHTYPEIKAKALANGVEVPGELLNSEVNTLLSKSHLLVNTSRMEGFSNTFIQAWMRNVPVVSLHVDPDDVLEKKNMGRCSKSFEKLVEDVRLLITNHDLRMKMGANARVHAMKYHSTDNIKRILPLFSG